jgi:hypothetical protein
MRWKLFITTTFSVKESDGTLTLCLTVLTYFGQHEKSYVHNDLMLLL